MRPDIRWGRIEDVYPPVLFTGRYRYLPCIINIFVRICIFTLYLLNNFLSSKQTIEYLTFSITRRFLITLQKKLPVPVQIWLDFCQPDIRPPFLCFLVSSRRPIWKQTGLSSWPPAGEGLGWPAWCGPAGCSSPRSLSSSWQYCQAQLGESLTGRKYNN